MAIYCYHQGHGDGGHRGWLPSLVCSAAIFSAIVSPPSQIVLTKPRKSGSTIVEAGQKAPKYFSEVGYSCPTEPRDGLMQYGLQTKLTVFEYMSSNPRILKDFNNFMGNTLGARKYWTDWFPIQERVLDSASEASPLLVDVGGGKGHDLLEFQAKYPQKAHRLVLQDLSPVTSDLGDLDQAIKRMTYDFFMEQPVKGKVVPCRGPSFIPSNGRLSKGL